MNPVTLLYVILGVLIVVIIVWMIVFIPVIKYLLTNPDYTDQDNNEGVKMSNTKIGQLLSKMESSQKFESIQIEDNGDILIYDEDKGRQRKATSDDWVKLSEAKFRSTGGKSIRVEESNGGNNLYSYLNDVLVGIYSFDDKSALINISAADKPKKVSDPKTQEFKEEIADVVHEYMTGDMTSDDKDEAIRNIYKKYGKKIPSELS